VTDWLDAIRSHVLALPDLAKFAVVVADIVGVPRLAARIALPPMVGLLLFGVALGPHVLGFFGEHRPIAEFFAELGKLLLMFSSHPTRCSVFRSFAASVRCVSNRSSSRSAPQCFRIHSR
jgi:hypothetical protein